jgi:transcriptional regulator with XRE-family HTH domain
MSTKHRKSPHPLAQEIGGRIRRIRKEQEFTFDAFVEETGLGRGYISELERGLVVPSVATLATVARALELTIADLVAGTSEREQLFLELRGAPPAYLRKVRAEAQLVDKDSARIVAPPRRPRQK